MALREREGNSVRICTYAQHFKNNCTLSNAQLALNTETLAKKSDTFQDSTWTLTYLLSN